MLWDVPAAKNPENRACKVGERCVGSLLFLERRRERRAAKNVDRRHHSSRIIMAVKIRMKRVGTKNTPVYRIVVADARSPRDGKFIEEIGTYQPLKKDTNFSLNLERAKYWVSKGAKPSDTVASFIKKAGRAAAAAAATAAPTPAT
jgi:small subunit ribosomal protein S16